MSEKPKLVLAVGATGSIGRFVVAELLGQGYRTRALVRNPARADVLPHGAEVVAGDLTRPDTLAAAVAEVHGIIFTHGTHGSVEDARAVDYGGVRNVLAALDGRRTRIALMTSIGVTARSTYAPHDWKRRGERLVRVSGFPYTIVRPGWFDYNAPDELRLVMPQGDKRQSGTPSDGAVSRREIAQVLVASLTSDSADHKTFELIAEQGEAQTDLEPLFAALRPDVPGALDAVDDAENMPIDQEPEPVERELEAARRAARPAGPVKR